MNDIIGTNSFKRGTVKLILYYIVITIALSFLWAMTVILNFETPLLIFSLLLTLFLGFLFFRFRKANLIIDDESISILNIWGNPANKFYWENILVADYQYKIKYAGKGHSNRRYFVLTTKPVKKNEPYSVFDILAEEYSEKDIQKILELMYVKLGREKLSDTLQESF